MHLVSLEATLMEGANNPVYSSYISAGCDSSITLSCRYLEKVRRNGEAGIELEDGIDDKTGYLQSICDQGKYHHTLDNVVIYSEMKFDLAAV